MHFIDKFSNKQITLACIFIIGAFFLFHYTSSFDFKPDLNGDNAHYYSLAKSLLEGKGYTNIISAAETPHTHFPPGYPVFGALVLSVFKSYLSLKIANGVLLFLAILLLFLLARRLSGSTPVALGAAVLCCMQAQLLRYGSIVMSEMLFTALTLLALYLASHLDPNRLFGNSRPRQVYAFILLTGTLCYIYLVRTMGASIVLAFFLFYGLLLLRQGWSYFQERKANPTAETTLRAKRSCISHLLVLAILVGAFACTKTAWDVRNRHAGSTQSDYLKDFKRKPKGEQMATFADWTERVQNNLLSYSAKWIPSAVLPYDYEQQQEATSRDWGRGIIVIALMLFGLLKLHKLRLLLFLYVGVTLGVLLIWPEQYASHRYFIGLIPLFIFLFVNGVFEALSLVARKLSLRTTVPAGVLFVVLCFGLLPRYADSLKGMKAFAQHKTWNNRVAPEAFVEYAYAINWCKTHLPADARVACRKSDIYYLFSGGQKAESFPQYAKPEDVFKGFKEGGITHVIIDRWFRHGYVTIYPVISKHYPEYFRPLVQFGKNTETQLPTLIFEFNPNGFTKDEHDN